MPYLGMNKNHPSSKEDRLQKNELVLLALLAIVQFTHIIDFMIVMPLGAQFMDIFEINPQQFSLIVTSYALAAFVSGLLSALFIDRFDRKKALFWLYVGFTIGTLACSFTESYTFFLSARMLTGAFGGVLGALVLSIVGDAIPLVRRGRAMGIIMTAFSVASVVGVPAGLYLAAHFKWNTPFLVTGLLSAVFCVAILIFMPSMTKHINQTTEKPRVFQAYANILKDNNQLRALLFNVILMLGHFTIIPFIAPYMQINIGFSEYQITYIYLCGGILTVFLLPYFGKLADRYGYTRVFTISSIAALFSIFAITNLPVVAIPIALIATSSFFVVASGRNVPALTLVTSVVKPENRGSFMSVRNSINEAALAASSFIAGLIVTEDANGQLEHYNYVGYIAIAMSILAILLARKIKVVN
ncbi:MAG: MFS transporter [Bacteroidota bacterium]